MAAETAGVPGLDDDTLARLVAQAEAGYDLATDVIRTEENPHFQKLRLVPEDLGEAILNRAIRDGRTARPTRSSARPSRRTCTPDEPS